MNLLLIISDVLVGYMCMANAGSSKVFNNSRLLEMEFLIREEFCDGTPDLKQRLESGIDVVEYGCAEGPVVIELAYRFPNSRFVATDYCPEAIEKCRAAINSKHLKNITAQHADLHNLPSDWTGKFDVGYVRDVIHDLGDPVKGTSELVRTVKDGGIVNIIELVLKGTNHKENRDDPIAIQFFVYSCTACLPDSLGQSNGSFGMGCTSGLHTIKDVLMKGGIPESQMGIFQLEHAPNNIRIVYRKPSK